MIERVISSSGRFQRLSMHSAKPPKLDLHAEILTLIDDAPRMLLLLRIMTTDGDEGLQRLVGPEFDRYMGFQNGIYRIGEEEFLDGKLKLNRNGIGQAVLPRGKVLGKEYPLAAITIPMLAERKGREDTFILAISQMGRRLEADVAVAWRNDWSCNDWPESRADLLKLLGKVQDVRRIINCLDPVRAYCAVSVA